MKVSHAGKILGEVRLPGDKSISHRAAMLASLAEGISRIENFGTSADCAATVNCLRSLGVKIGVDRSTLTVKGVGKNGLVPAAGPLDCENSGTTMRLMAGILAGHGFRSTLTGDGSLRGRPMKRVITPLTEMGAEIESEDGRAPLHITGRTRLRAVEHVPEAASAQLKSCVLLAGLNADGITSILESVQTRDHTERMLRWLGAEIATIKQGEGTRISVSGDSILSARDFSVPGDISSAAFFIVAAAFIENSRLKIRDVGMNSSRAAIVDVLSGLGADITVENKRETCNEPVADLAVRGRSPIGSAGGYLISGGIVPNLIDEIPVLAVAGTQLPGGIEVRDAGELRIKESDRISTVVQNLRRMGADVVEFDDGLKVGRSRLRGAEIDTFGDHRIAMAFAVAGLFAEGETLIHGAECAAVSFPGFFDTLASVIY